jgi:hypothetical protein
VRVLWVADCKEASVQVHLTCNKSNTSQTVPVPKRYHMITLDTSALLTSNYYGTLW